MHRWCRIELGFAAAGNGTNRQMLRRGMDQAAGVPAATESAAAKLFASEALVQSCLDAVQVHGGSGYATEYTVERDLRDAVGSRLYSGTSDIQRAIIARALGL